MDINEMLGIDTNDAGQWLATELMREEREMLSRLVAIRKEKFKQAEIGALMGVSQSAVAKIETGDRDPRLSTLRRYAAALGVLLRYDVLEEREWKPAVRTGFSDTRQYTERVRVRGGLGSRFVGHF